MANELLIEAGPHETRVAVLEDGEIVEVHIERASESAIVGSLYKGRVSRVVPGIQAAFVDIGLDRDAFLFAGDLRKSDLVELVADDRVERQRAEPRPIAEQVEQGQELLVQALKEPLPGKGARISSQVSLPGRFLVLLPGASGVGVSRRISETQERERLDSCVAAMLAEGEGVIVRTAAVGKSAEILERDLGWLRRTWTETANRAAGIAAPGVVRREAGLAERAVRDFLNDDISGLSVDGPDAYEALREYLAEVDPETVNRLSQLKEEDSLFEHRGVDTAIAKALRTRIWLASGGFIVINPTEALVAIDVNSGRNTDRTELEATARQTNLEAAIEVAHQIRLRDLAGIIVVDFIDMVVPENRAELVKTFEQALSRDRTRLQISEMSDFGLIAVTRKRMRGGLRQRLTQVCTCCSGEGRIKDPTTVGLELEREIRRRHPQPETCNLGIRLHPQTKAALENEQAALLVAIKNQVGGTLDLKADEKLALDAFEIDAG